MTPNKILVGLGNPGCSFQQSRHNLGAICLENYARAYRFPPFKLEAKFQSLITRQKLFEHDVLIVLPQTFMNLSGQAVQSLMQFYRLDPQQDLLAVYDDLDLDFGHFKISTSSPQSHNGVLSLRTSLGVSDFHQLRLGVDDRRGRRQIPSADYVLQNFSPDQLQIITAEVFPAAQATIDSWLSKK